jgi:hypothetical protein
VREKKKLLLTPILVKIYIYIIILHLGLDIGDRKLLPAIYLFFTEKNDLTRAKRLKAGWIVLGIEDVEMKDETGK